MDGMPGGVRSGIINPPKESGRVAARRNFLLEGIDFICLPSRLYSPLASLIPITDFRAPISMQKPGWDPFAFLFAKEEEYTELRSTSIRFGPILRPLIALR